MTNQEIEARLENLVNQERRITREILHLINLAEDRRLYLAAGGSLIRWLIKRYGYSEPAAVRRVQSARLLRAVPAVDAKLQTGEVNITTLAKTQSVIRAEEKRTDEKVEPERKAEVAAAIQGQSFSETERTLAGLFPETMKAITQEKVRLVANDEVRVSLTLPREVYELVQKVQNSLGHALPEADLAQLIAHVFADYWKRKDPARESKRATPAAAQGETAKRREVFRRAGSACEHVDPRSKERCGSRVRLEVDHIRPRALGGGDELGNLRLLCRAHNQARAEETFGAFRTEVPVNQLRPLRL